MASKIERTYELLLKVLSDGNVHTTKEITDAAVAAGIVTTKDSASVRSIIHQLRQKKSEIEMVSRGNYKKS